MQKIFIFAGQKNSIVKRMRLYFRIYILRLRKLIAVPGILSVCLLIFLSVGCGPSSDVELVPKDDYVLMVLDMHKLYSIQTSPNYRSLYKISDSIDIYTNLCEVEGIFSVSGVHGQIEFHNNDRCHGHS